MENATKALLIAAAILIAIVLIAVGTSVLSSTSGVTEEVGEVTEATGTAVFNSQFTKYTGTQSAAEVKALLSQAAATHRGSSTTHKVNVQLTGKDLADDANEIMALMSFINVNQSYSVIVSIDTTTGFVNSITIS